MKKPLQTFNRVHIDSHFVIIFKINHIEHIVEIYYFDHHDNVYKWRPNEKRTGFDGRNEKIRTLAGKNKNTSKFRREKCDRY